MTEEKAIRADGATGVVAFDADGDTVTDLVFFGPSGPPRLLRNGRLGPFVADARLDALGPAVSGTVGDVDGDGILDLVLVRPDGALALARGDGRGGYALDPGFPTVRLDAKFAAVGDFDGDGRPDVLAVGTHVSVVRGLANARWRVEGTSLPADRARRASRSPTSTATAISTSSSSRRARRPACCATRRRGRIPRCGCGSAACPTGSRDAPGRTCAGSAPRSR